MLIRGTAYCTCEIVLGIFPFVLHVRVPLCDDKRQPSLVIDEDSRVSHKCARSKLFRDEQTNSQTTRFLARAPSTVTQKDRYNFTQYYCASITLIKLPTRQRLLSKCIFSRSYMQLASYLMLERGCTGGRGPIRLPYD